ncbi:MAG: extracellular solute-binding protein [Rhodospirillales bacterium]|jgi:putative spermidine/putrescine transport system substrate-binding protein
MPRPTHPTLRTVSRRAALLSGAAAAGLLSAPAVLRAQSKPSQLVVATGGGKLDDAYKQTVFKAFTQKTGIPIVTTANPPAKLKSMVEQKAVEWDLMQGPAEDFIVHGRNGLFERIDYGVVSKAGLLDGVAHDHFLLTDIAAYHIAWNTRNLKGPAPKTWADVWAYSGRIGLWKRPFQTLEVALMADGVPIDKLYPLDIERGLKSLERIKAKLAWWERGAQGGQVFIDGEVDVGAIWNGRVHEPKLNGAPVDFHFNQAVLVNDAWAIPKGAKNLRWSMELIALNMTAEIQAAYSRVIPYGPVNADAIRLLDAKTLASLPSIEPGYAKGRLLDLAFWADNGPQTVDRFNKWLLS